MPHMFALRVQFQIDEGIADTRRVSHKTVMKV